jgi:hypothetical protein
MNKLKKLHDSLNTINQQISAKQFKIDLIKSSINDLKQQKADIEKQIRKEKEPQIGDIYIYNGVTDKFKLMVAQVGEPTSPLYCLICLDSFDKGKRWDEPTPDINKVWGLQKANEFTKVEE